MIKILKTALLALVLAVTGLLVSPNSSWALGPNMMCNSGFEGGNQGGYVNLGSSTYNVYNDPNAYAGSWDVKANLTGGYSNFYQPVPVWTNTNYTSSIWYKGSGQISFNIIKGDWSGTISSTTITGSSSWQQVTLSYKTGSQTTVYVQCEDMATGTMYLDNMFTGLNNATDIGFNPGNPGASGFNNLIVDDEFNSTSTIDVNATQDDGYLWYVNQWFGESTTPSSDFSIANGILTMSGGNLETAIPYSTSTGWKGTGFQAGSGLYAEARIAMENASSITVAAGWPSFWLQDLETDSGIGDDMPGNPGHTEGVENDILEYNPVWWGNTDYGSTMHDWIDGNGTANGNNSLICPTVGTDMTQYHTYGMLWVPASASNNYYGYRQAFFDGKPMAAVMWIGNQDYTAGLFPPTTTSLGSYMFSLIDQHISNLQISTATLTAPTMNVDYVHVYAVNLSSKVVITSGPGGGPPSVPTGLKPTPGNGQVALSWTAGSEVIQYYIFRGTSSGNETYLAASLAASYTDTSVTNGTKYFYTVAANNSYGTTNWSNEVNATPNVGGQAPSPPTGLAAIGGDGEVSLTWTASTGASAYDLYRSTTSGGESGHEVASGIVNTSFTDSGLANSTTYYYTVVAMNGALSSISSHEASATTKTIITGFTISPSVISGGSSTGGAITLSGKAPTAGYLVNLSVPTSAQSYVSVPATVTVPSGASTVNFTGIKCHTVSTTESVTVTAAFGASSLSASFTITPITGGAQPSGMAFFSLPWYYSDTLPNIFVSPLVPDQIANWNGTSYTYQGGSSTSPTAVTISLGKAYWGSFPTGGDSLIYLGSPASSTTPVTVALTAGWNTIGNPYTTPTSISSLTFGANKTSFAAASKLLISPTLYFFIQGASGSSGSYWPAGSGSSLVPGQGYWLYANSATTMTFPLPASSSTTTITSTPGGPKHF